MWAVDNQTPYAADRTWGRNKDGVHEWIVAVKGTFDIHPDGTLSRASKQVEPLFVPEYNGDPLLSSIKYEADLVALKPTTDILLNGSAYAPQGEPSRGFTVSLRVDSVQKQLNVVGNRVWEKTSLGLAVSPMEPVTQVPILYEKAYGGFDQSDPNPNYQRMDARNPVGCGMVSVEGQPLPNFENAGLLGSKEPAGYGPIASYWTPRRELQGTYDEAWQKGRFPLLPDDWNPQSLLCSPANQRPSAHLRGGEAVELQNLTPQGKLAFKLPKAAFRFRTRLDGKTIEHIGQLATVIIEPDFPRVIMVWQSVLLVKTNGDYLDETIISEKTYLQ